MTDSPRRLGEVGPTELKQLLDKGEVKLIDVREVHENQAERIAGGELVPLSTFGQSVPREQQGPVVFYCRSGNRTGKNAALFLETGYGPVYHLAGGIEGWKAAGLPIERG
jgi:rhodanese-related sulfurtransferase